jgi:hypothetical protein
MGDLLYGHFAAEGSIGLWDAGAAEIFLGEDIGCDLAPVLGDFHIFQLKLQIH